MTSLHIPEPCRYDWQQMTPQEKGRLCAQCDKVVRDFTHLTTEEIQEELKTVSGRTCGRVRAEQITPVPPRHVEWWVKFPVQRLRVFIFAFIAVFGMEVWGLSQAQASEWATLQAELQDPTLLADYLAEPQSGRITLRGKVLDAEDGSPVEYAAVVIEYQGEVVTGSYTNEDGYFKIVFDTEETGNQPYSVRIRYLSNEVVKENVATDIEEMLVFITTGVTLKDVSLVAEEFHGRNIHILEGDLIHHHVIRSSTISKCYFQGGYFERGLNRSDIFFREGDPPK